MSSQQSSLSFFNDQSMHAFTALEKAHFIAFAPYAFHASVLLRDYQILALLNQAESGLTLSALANQVSISSYGLRILLEAGIGIGLLFEEGGFYKITKTGSLFNSDAMVNVNTNFMRDICYDGAARLKESIESGKPAGLSQLGPWNTIYEGLTEMTPLQTRSWFDFDHYYSDFVFPIVMPILFKEPVRRILDIGANTGKFSAHCLAYNTDVQLTLIDLGKQLQLAGSNLEKAGYTGRFNLIEHNMLHAETVIPGEYDIIWMSQFLDCFSDAEIVSILKKCKGALAPGGKIVINETFWDQQPFPAARYALQMTSLYFTTIANGNSQMYDSRVFKLLLQEAGLTILEEMNPVAQTHTLLCVA